MNDINLKSLEIKKIIASSIIYKNYKNIDLINIFFHEIMIYATNFYMLKISKKNYIKKINFPFLNVLYVKNIPKLYFENFDRKYRLIYKIINFLQSFFLYNTKIDIESNAQFQVKKFIIKNFFKYKFYQSINSKIFVADKDKQFDRIYALLEKISSVIEVKNKKNDFIFNFIKYVNSYISQTPVFAKSDTLIVGSNTNLLSRLNSAIYLSQGKKVISFSHGEHNSFILDEPVVGYAEMTYCSDYINFGKNPDFSKLKYSSPVMKLPKMHYRSSKIIKKYYKNKNVIHKNLDKETKVLYVPTLFSGYMRYGPFRDMEDDLYEKWQNAIMKLDYNITYKLHPKNKITKPLKYKKISRKNLKNILNKYDFYILDYISTASALLIGTDKPVIFFNLGMRNLLEDAKYKLKKRVFWVDIDLDKDLNFQIKKAINDFNQIKKNYVNEYTKDYSFSANDKSDVEILERVLSKN